MKVPVYRPALDGNEQKYVSDCLSSTWISSRGTYVDRFEREFCDYVGCQYATSVFNGTVALHLALIAAGIKHGDEVIVPAFTYVASVNTIVQAGAIPIFVDSRQEDWQLDVAEVRRKVSRRTRAVMAVHLYGQACPMTDLVEVCRENDLLLIEDCAEAIGTRFLGQHVGTFGDVATFSFFGNKTITTGEGGMVVSKCRDIIERARLLKNQGVSPEKEYWHDVFAFNYRMTNIQAAIGCAQLERVDSFLARKREIAERYRDVCRKTGLAFHEEQPGTTHSFWMCSAIARSSAARTNIRKRLAERGIETRPAFPLVPEFPMYSATASNIGRDFPNGLALSQRGFNLPSAPDLSDDEVQYVCDALSEIVPQENK